MISKRYIIWLTVWLVGVLFPLRWIGRYSESYEDWFDRLFGPEWLHVVSHLLLFAGLAVLLAKGFGWVIRPGPALLIFGAALGMGLLQEGVQALSLGELDRLGALFDLGVDLTGAGFGLTALAIWRVSRGARKEPLCPPTPWH